MVNLPKAALVEFDDPLVLQAVSGAREGQVLLLRFCLFSAAFVSLCLKKRMDGILPNIPVLWVAEM